MEVCVLYFKSDTVTIFNESTLEKKTSDKMKLLLQVTAVLPALI